jgi:hypothetical protein
MDFWLFFICFIIVLFKFINIFKFDNRCFIKDYLWKHICIIADKIYRFLLKLFLLLPSKINNFSHLEASLVKFCFQV